MSFNYDFIAELSFTIMFCFIMACHSPASRGDLVEEHTKTRSDMSVQTSSDMDEPLQTRTQEQEQERIWGVPTVKISLSPARWARLINHLEDDIEVLAYCTFGVHAPIEVRMELHGYSSRKYEKRNFKLKFPIPIDLGLFSQSLPLQTLIFKGAWKDHSVIREALSWRVLDVIGHPTPQLSWVHLEINDQDYGLYQVVEPIDEGYFIRRGYPAGGSLYKGVNQSATFRLGHSLMDGFEQKESLASNNSSRSINDERDQGGGGSSQVNLDQLDGWDDLIQLQTLIQTLPDLPTLEEVYEHLSPSLSVEWILDRVAWMAYTQATDARSQNFYLYNYGTLYEPLWLWVDWDADMSFSAFWRVNILSQPWDVIPLLTGGTLLTEKLTAVSILRSSLALRLESLLTGPLSPEHVTGWVSDLEERLGRAIDRDLALWNRGYTRRQVFAPIYAFAQHRSGFLLSLLDAFREDRDFDLNAVYMPYDDEDERAREEQEEKMR